MNYDPSQVGVPYVRAHRVTLVWPDSIERPLPHATIEQSLAVKLADGTIRTLEEMSPIEVELDFSKHGNDPVPLISPENAEPLGTDTNLNQAMLAVLALVRQYQIIAQG